MEQKAKQYAFIGAGLAALIFSVAAWNFASSYSQSIEPSSFRSFSVSGEGKVVAVPDVAKFTFSVITQGGKNLGDLQKQNIEKMNTAIEYVKGQNIDEKDIKTQAFNVEPRYQYYGCENGACPPAEIVGYTVTQSVEVKVRDFEKAGDILAGVVTKGANNVSSLQFTIDDPTNVQNKARAEAIQKAMEKAKSIASAGNFSVGRLLGIDENSYQPYYSNDVRMMSSKALGAGAMEAAVPSAVIQPGSQDVTVNVTLRYEIK